MCIKVFYKYHHMQSTLYIQKKLTRYTNEHFFLNYGCNYIYLSKFRSYLLKLDCTITCKIHYIYRRSSWDTQMNIFFWIIDATVFILVNPGPICLNSNVLTNIQKCIKFQVEFGLIWIWAHLVNISRFDVKFGWIQI